MVKKEDKVTLSNKESKQHSNQGSNIYHRQTAGSVSDSRFWLEQRSNRRRAGSSGSLDRSVHRDLGRKGLSTRLALVGERSAEFQSVLSERRRRPRRRVEANETNWRFEGNRLVMRKFSVWRGVALVSGAYRYHRDIEGPTSSCSPLLRSQPYSNDY